MKRWALRTGKMVAGILVLVLMVSGQASADLITDGGFDSGNFNGWTENFVTSLTASVQQSGNGGYSSQNGPDYALLGNTLGFTGTLSQTISTTVGTSYTFTFYLANSGPNSAAFQAFWGSKSLLPNNPVGPNGQAYTKYSFTETATSTSTAISFNYSTYNSLALDSVSVVDPPPAAPEPSTAIVGLVGGLAMTGYVWRARRRAGA